MTSNQSAPTPSPPSESWEHFELWQHVREIFRELPTEFKSTIKVEGISATEIFSFGAALGFTIEEEVVRTLNALRIHWDPTEEYADYVFVRQGESFPDVLLKRAGDNVELPILGIELKSWYLLAKEGEPSYRFKTTPAACAPQDLHVVVPWVLSNVVSGVPIVFEPYVGLSSYMAEYRNYWWQHLRETEGDTTIRSPQGVTPYPAARTSYSDEAVEDSGNNFGRIARIGIIDDWVEKFDDLTLIGISVGRWREFFKGPIISKSKRKRRPKATT